MPETRKPALSTKDFDLDEDEDRGKVEIFKRGEIGRIIKTSLLELVANNRSGQARERIERFVKWLPPDNLEDFLVLCLEYGCDRTTPKTPTRRTRSIRA